MIKQHTLKKNLYKYVFFSLKYLNLPRAYPPVRYNARLQFVSKRDPITFIATMLPDLPIKYTIQTAIALKYD